MARLRAADAQAATARASGQLGVLPRAQIRMYLTVPLHESLQHHALGWHVDSESQGFGREDHLDQALLEQVLDDFLKCRKHTGVVGCYSPLEGLRPIDVVECGEIVVRDTHRSLGDG